MLDILTCRKTVGHITGNKSYNGATVTQPLLQEVSSYVTQEDAFHPTQTVLEAVMFHANMRLDANIPQSEKLQMAQEMIDLAGLKGKVSLAAVDA
jgi:ABC-type multidrug transport system ATPase subunit